MFLKGMCMLTTIIACLHEQKKNKMKGTLWQNNQAHVCYNSIEK